MTNFINGAAPPCFKCYNLGIPDMRLVDGPGTSEDDVWQAATMVGKEHYILDVGWWPHNKKYVCRMILNKDWEQPQEVRTLDYPHEVVVWVGTWFKRFVGRGATMPDPDPAPTQE